MQKGTTVTSVVYCRAIQNERHSILKYSIVSLHENVCPLRAAHAHCKSVPTGSCLATLLTTVALLLLLLVYLPEELVEVTALY
jgi:hypothetical protein